MKLKITADLDIDEATYNLFGSSEENMLFINKALFGEDLVVHSNYVGDDVGTLKILNAAVLYHNNTGDIIKINIKPD